MGGTHVHGAGLLLESVPGWWVFTDGHHFLIVAYRDTATHGDMLVAYPWRVDN